ncbi:McbB family protein [Paenibacillus polymyxa]|uniref:McbB family protein n=1 Tax=Paenibacillus polymyxa TaxID=1406 RepID=UPI002379E364|nr:McbB family protein [Paenibacillus polymyxa]WDM20588.1 McbB family protein [Paenibacillus polymyxa]
MIFSLNNYIIHNLENGSAIVQNQESIFTVTDENLRNILFEWDKEQVEEISINMLEDIFREDTDEVIDFLKQYNILLEQTAKTIQVDKIVVASNNNFIGNSIYQTIFEDYNKKLTVEFCTLDRLPPVVENELTIVFLSPYNKKIGRKILQRQQERKNSKLLCTYIYHSNFYMDCLYSPSWKVPCHLCHIGHIESSGLTEGDGENMTYQNMIDLLYKENDNFLVEIPLSSVQKINIISSVVNKVSEYLGDFSYTKIHREDVTSCTLLDLKSLKKYKDTSLHWELCNCYES